MTANGILPRQAIVSLIEVGALKLEVPAAKGQLQPASIDLRLGAEAFRIRASFLPQPGETVAGKLGDLVLHKFDLGGGAVLETGCVYLVPLLEALELPADLAATANPKSSTGRLDVFTRVIADGVPAFDQMPAGYRGKLYAEICPQTFPIVVRTGSRLSQVRFRRGPQPDARSRVVDLSVDLAATGAGDGLVGYRAKRHTGVIDVDRPGAYATADFWEPIRHGAGTNRLILDPNQFYILASKEAVTVPPDEAAEMVPFNPLVGEFRVHYAGFFDPGFGFSATGGAGARAVLEVRSHTVPFILEHGQTIGRLIYEPMTERPDVLYGAGLASNYQGQGLKLSKHFY